VSAESILPIRPEPDAAALPTIEDLRERPEAAAIEPLLVPTPDAARLCGISEASWYRLKAAAKTPAPVRLSGRVLYRVADLRLWVERGCPPRKQFDAIRAAQ
jgi:predicted DNA-binding transcriptional regulator AlpA